MGKTEAEILYIEDDPKGEETAKDIFRKNKVTKTTLYLKGCAEANDYIFCTGQFSDRDIYDQPQIIIFNMKMMRTADMKFYNKIISDERTKNITRIIISLKSEKEKWIAGGGVLNGALLLCLFAFCKCMNYNN